MRRWLSWRSVGMGFFAEVETVLVPALSNATGL